MLLFSKQFKIAKTWMHTDDCNYSLYRWSLHSVLYGMRYLVVRFRLFISAYCATCIQYIKLYCQVSTDRNSVLYIIDTYFRQTMYFGRCRLGQPWQMLKTYCQSGKSVGASCRTCTKIVSSVDIKKHYGLDKIFFRILQVESLWTAYVAFIQRK